MPNSRLNRTQLLTGLVSSFFILLLVVGSGRAFAHEQEEVRFLMNQLDRLEQRVLMLEQGGGGVSNDSVGGTAPGYAWDSLREGMNEQQVLELLGRPGKIHEAGGTTNWFYPDLLGGSVHFKSGRVSGWQKP